LRSVCFAECPSITMKALNRSRCQEANANEYEVVIENPSTVTFSCVYENPPPIETLYTWSLDGKVQFSKLNMHTAHIHIPSGSHEVKCHASIKNGAEFPTSAQLTPEQIEQCKCYDEITISVAVIGTCRCSFRSRFPNNLIILWLWYLGCIFKLQLLS